jgi:Divergent InlB B-repeat domain
MHKNWLCLLLVALVACPSPRPVDINNTEDPVTIHPVYNLKITSSGSGTVVSTPKGIDCPQTCELEFNANTSITLTATPATGHQFTGWGGACSGNDVCFFDIRDNTQASATFAPILTFALQVSVQGLGQVVSSPAGIQCPDKCEQVFPENTKVSLTATPDAGQRFVAWAGACMGSADCTVSITKQTQVQAKFEPSAVVKQVEIAARDTAIDFGDSTAYTATVVGTGEYDKTVNWLVSETCGGEFIPSTTTSGQATKYYPPDTGENDVACTISATSTGDVSKKAAARLGLRVKPDIQNFSAETTPDSSDVNFVISVSHPKGRSTTCQLRTEQDVTFWGPNPCNAATMVTLNGILGSRFETGRGYRIRLLVTVGTGAAAEEWMQFTIPR